MSKFRYHNLLTLKTRLHSKGYIETYYPKHPNAKKGGYIRYHKLVMENLLGRFLLPNEIVHHKDLNKQNNTPSNLQLLQSQKEHSRLHRIKPPKRTCPTCEKTFIVKTRNYYKQHSKYSNKKYCSHECSRTAQKKAAVKKSHNRSKYQPTKEKLSKLVWEKPTTHIAKDFGVSDKAVEKWCKKYEIKKPPRGYWTKQKAKNT